MSIVDRIDKIEKKVRSLNGAREVYSQNLESCLRSLEKLDSGILLEEKVLVALNYVSSLNDSNMSSLITQALKTIYGSDYSFIRGAKSVQINDEFGNFDLDELGGGLTDLLSVILRIVVVAQGKVGRLKTLLLDEPLTNVDTETAIRTSYFLKKLSERLGMSFVVVTHRPELIEAADTVYRFDKVDNKTEVTLITPEAEVGE